MIANPTAGGFVMPERVRANERHLREALDAVRDRPIRVASCAIDVLYTTGAGDARLFAHDFLEKAARDASPQSVYFAITAGGDGTSLEVQSELAKQVLEDGRKELVDRVCLLRLPLGTGNDGSDGRTLDECLSLLTGDAKFAHQCAVRVRTARNSDAAHYAFNIASIGVDAFVTHMTNKVKNIFPGNFYKIWVDVACIFYDRLYRVGTMAVTARDADGNVVKSHSDRMLLYVMGASGSRTYGSNQKILPDADNVCGLRDMNLLRKLKLKKFIKEGFHRQFPETIMYSAHSVEISYGEKILVQLDGEAHPLEPADFPIVMELTEPFITILKK